MSAGKRITTTPEIYGFMHVARVNDWRQIVDEQVLKLRASGLLERTARVFVGFVGEDGGTEWALPEKFEVVHSSADVGEAERPTLVALQAFCRREDCLVYYIHTKGVINTSPGTREWRHSMEHFVIHRHADCIAQLDAHDICGINWADRGWCRFFGGNFWWARSEYIRTLPDLATMQPIPGFDPAARYVCERWIGENPHVRPANLFDSLTDHYAGQPLPRSRYANVREVILPPGGRSAAIEGTLWDGLENRFQDLLDPVDPIRVVVQVGLGDGYALYCLSAALPQATVIVVDPHRTPSREFMRAMPNVVVVQAERAAAAQQIAERIDVVHLEGESWGAARDDEFARWSANIRPGGCVLVSGPGHDRWRAPSPGRNVVLHHRAGLGAWYKPLCQHRASPELDVPGVARSGGESSYSFRSARLPHMS